MEDLATAFIGSVMRWLLAMATGFLVAHSVITAELEAKLLLAIPLIVAGLVWSYFTKKRDAERFKIALALPAGASPEKVEQVRKANDLKNNLTIK